MGAILAVAREVLSALGLGASFAVGSELIGPGIIGGGGSPTNALPGGSSANTVYARLRAPRRRRRKALTENDIKLMLQIATSVSKKAAEAFVLQRTRAS